MYLLIGAAAVFVVMLIIIGLFIMFQRSRGDQVIEASAAYDEEMDYDGLEDKDFVCRNCGDVVDPFDEECPSCGYELTLEFECPYCHGDIDDPRELVCPHCGEALMKEVTVCPDCESVVPNSATHCEVCGADFWSPIFLSPRKQPKFQPPEYPDREEEEMYDNDNEYEEDN